jgi:hypothetical protein
VASQNGPIAFRFVFVALCGVFITAAPRAGAQDGTPKPRLELADSAARNNRTSRPEPATATVAPVAAKVIPARAKPVSAASNGNATTPPAPAIAAGFRGDFVRNQAVLGAAIYAPALATVVAPNDIAWGVSYLFVAGGSYVAAAEFSRQVKVTDPMQQLATHLPIRGAIAGALLSEVGGADRQLAATAMLVGSVGGTAVGLWRGRTMDSGEAAATIFGSDVLGLAGYGIATAAGVTAGGIRNRTRLTAMLAGMVAGAPLGQAYAALAPYNVSAGDLTAMTASAGVGMLAGLTAIANGAHSERETAVALTAGGLAGLVAGDFLLARRYDHSVEQGRWIAAGGIAGGLMGAGVALLTGSAESRWTTLTAGLTTLGAATGVALAQRYSGPAADRGVRIGSLELNPIGFVAAASGARGSYTLGSIRF